MGFIFTESRQSPPPCTSQRLAAAGDDSLAARRGALPRPLNTTPGPQTYAPHNAIDNRTESPIQSRWHAKSLQRVETGHIFRQQSPQGYQSSPSSGSEHFSSGASDMADTPATPLTTPGRSSKNSSNAFKFALIAQGSLGAPPTAKASKASKSNDAATNNSGGTSPGAVLSKTPLASANASANTGANIPLSSRSNAQAQPHQVAPPPRLTSLAEPQQQQQQQPPPPLPPHLHLLEAQGPTSSLANNDPNLLHHHPHQQQLLVPRDQQRQQQLQQPRVGSTSPLTPTLTFAHQGPLRFAEDQHDHIPGSDFDPGLGPGSSTGTSAGTGSLSSVATGATSPHLQHTGAWSPSHNYSHPTPPTGLSRGNSSSLTDETSGPGVMSSVSGLPSKSHALQPQQAQGPSATSSQTTLGPASNNNNNTSTSSTGLQHRSTPQASQSAEEMTVDDVSQLLKDHKELREKYIKVKKYYFEKEDQVKQLQNSLAHQKLAQSRTSLDDSEYSARFNRLDGLTAQLAFGIRKNWRTIPSWLAASINKDAISTGKQEMTAAGRAFISCWLVEEVFEKYFHPDLEPNLSAHLKAIQRNIRRLAPTPQTVDEDAAISARIIGWRLATLEGLSDMLQSPQSSTYRAQLLSMLKEHLIGALAVHLQDPPMSDLEGGVQMIIELAVGLTMHLPLESRDVHIDYFMPGEPFRGELMKLESGIPPLSVTVAEDASESRFKKNQNTLKNNGLGNNSHESGEDDRAGRVRMAIGISAHVRFKTTLAKAPVFGT